jgi:hypothetical protein
MNELVTIECSDIVQNDTYSGTLGGWGGRGGWCSWGGSTSGSHLDWYAATEWTSAGSVLAADHADILLSSDGTSASLASWDGGGEWEIGHGVGTVVAVAALNLGSNINCLPVTSGTVGIDHAGVWACTVTIDLVEGHVDGATGGDLWELVSILLHDSLGASLDVILSTLVLDSALFEACKRY